MPTPPLTVLGAQTMLPLYDPTGSPTGPTAARRYQRMTEQDPLTGAFMLAALATLRAVPWQAEPNPQGTKRAAQQEADWLDSVWEDMSHTPGDFIMDALTLLPYGWAYFETVYKLREGEGDDPTRRSAYTDGRYGWRKLALRPQVTLSRWEHDGDGGVRGMWQRVGAGGAGGEVFIPIERALHFRLGGPGSGPEGRSVLKNAYRPWYFATMLEEFEAVGIERNTAGIPHMQVPPEYLSADATPAQAAAVADLEHKLAQLRQNRLQFLLTPSEQEARVTEDEKGNERVTAAPTGWKFALLGGANATANPEPAINRHAQRQAQALLSEFLMLGMKGGGSLAMHSDKTSLLVNVMTAVLDVIEEGLNRHGVQRLYALNGVPPRNRARLAHGPVTGKDVEALAGVLEKLVRAGVLTPDDQLEDFTRKTYDLPERDPDTARTPPQPQQPGQNDGQDNTQPGQQPPPQEVQA